MSWYKKYDPLAQSVEHLTFNQGVRDSSSRWVTKAKGSTFVLPFALLIRFGMRILQSASVYLVSALSERIDAELARRSSFPMGHQNIKLGFSGLTEKSAHFSR